MADIEDASDKNNKARKQVSNNSCSSFLLRMSANKSLSYYIFMWDSNYRCR